MTNTREKECLSCREMKPFREMRSEGVTRGKTKDVCRGCRADRPDDLWCNAHKKFEPKSKFQTLSSRFGGYQDRCKLATAESKGLVMYGYGMRECESCHEELDSSHFRSKGRTGGLRSVCKNCELGRAGERRCEGCEEWLPLAMFTPKSGGGYRLRCRPCHSAHQHKMKVSEILAVQGSVRPECAACGGDEELHVDHDHSCCSGNFGCKKCVRGYLCRKCNLAEGMLVTATRAEKLASYMRRHGIGIS